MLTRHDPDTVPTAIAGYTQGMELAPGARLYFISGQIPERPGQELPLDFRGQCEAVWQSIIAMLEDAEMTVENLVKVTTFLTSREYVQENREVRQHYLGDTQPAMTVVIAQTVDVRWLLETEAIAVRYDGKD